MSTGTAPPAVEFDLLLGFFKVLADASRLKIVGCLATGEATVSELAANLDLREPTVSHHLSRLREAGLVTGRAEGTHRVYALDLAQLERLARSVFSTEALATMGAPVDPNRWRQKVLDTYFVGEKLDHIPSSRTKRLVVLEWLVERFEPDRRYPEKELNEILLRHHWDSATLRREMIANRLMARDRGLYWRL